MSYKEMAVVNKLSEAISQPKKTETSSYDASARIERIEDGIAWVYIEGGVLETPVALTIDAKVGDTVQVLVSNGHASIIGNRTAPPTDDTTANAANKKAGNALDLAEKTEEHFWNDNTGAYVTKKAQDEFKNDPENGGGNTKITSDGLSVRDGVKDLASFKSSGVIVGEAEKPHVQVVPGGINFFENNEKITGTIGKASETTRSHTVGNSFYDDVDHIPTKTIEAQLSYPPISNLVTIEIYGMYISPRPFTSEIIEVTVDFVDGTTDYILKKKEDYGGGNVGITVTSIIDTENLKVTFIFTPDDENVWMCGGGAFVTYVHFWNPPHFGFGDLSLANSYGEAAAALNFTEASGPYQTTVGKYNEKDIYGRYAFAVGVGSGPADPPDDSGFAYYDPYSTEETFSRKTGFAVDWEGTSYHRGIICDSDVTAREDVYAGNGNSLSQIGECEVFTRSTGKNVPKSTYTTVVTATGLTAGQWLMIGLIKYPSTDTSGRRYAQIGTNNNDHNDYFTSSMAVSGATTALQVAYVADISSTSDKRYLVAYQTSGSTLSVSWAKIIAIRINTT